MIMFIRFRADNGPVGQMGQHIRVGHVGHWSVPVIRWPILLIRYPTWFSGSMKTSNGSRTYF